MDKTIRRNTACVIGLPRCDFVFSSTRSCFIAYGFSESKLEVSILSNLLEKRGIQPVEADGQLAPGQSAFCAKICSKIITSQFCIVLLNNDTVDGRESPNANVNMEYGLILGFNKYVIPFQRQQQKLPFNVAGLDTIKYTQTDFENKAIKAIDQAIKETTQQEAPAPDTSDQWFQMFLLNRDVVVAPSDTEGDRSLIRLGQPLGYNLLHDFSGDRYVYFGRFASFRPEAVVWRIRKLSQILDSRRAFIPKRAQVGLIAPSQLEAVEGFFLSVRIWIVVTAPDHKKAIEDEFARSGIAYALEILSLDDILREIVAVHSDGAI